VQRTDREMRVVSAASERSGRGDGESSRLSFSASPVCTGQGLGF
jgi:hypothetical protein